MKANMSPNCRQLLDTNKSHDFLADSNESCDSSQALMKVVICDESSDDRRGRIQDTRDCCRLFTNIYFCVKRGWE